MIFYIVYYYKMKILIKICFDQETNTNLIKWIDLKYH